MLVLAGLWGLSGSHAWATNTIQGTSEVEVTADPGFSGMYKYTFHLTWDLYHSSENPAYFYVRLGALTETCEGSTVIFPAPAGTTPGDDDGSPCEATFQGEYFFRRLSNFLATGPVPQDALFDHGFFAQAMYMAVPKHLGVYASYSRVFDEFGRRPWELSGGASYFPFQARSFRLNLHLIYVERSPTGSNFGFYTAGQTGTTVSLGADILL